MTLKYELSRIFLSFLLLNRPCGLGGRNRNPYGTHTLVWCLIRAVSCFLGTLNSAAPALGLRAQGDWVTGVALSSWGLSWMYPLWSGPYLCWLLYGSSWVMAPPDCSPRLWSTISEPRELSRPGIRSQWERSWEGSWKGVSCPLVPGSVWFSVETARAPLRGSKAIRLRGALEHSKGLPFQSGTLGSLCWNPIYFLLVTCISPTTEPAAHTERLCCLCEGERTWS